MTATRTHPAPGLSATDLTLAWQSASLLIGYPDEQLVSRLPLLRDAASRLPAKVAGPLLRFMDHLESTPLTELAADYVATFDHRRRACLFLTYFSTGDTRKRGVALLSFKQAYQAHGLELSDDELPDHLAVVLEFGATGDQATAWQLLLDHRAGLELLRISLRDGGSPWAPVVESVCATLPPLRGGERDAVLKLAAEGPPDEEVGLAPFSMPELVGSPAGGGADAGPVSLPMPTFGGRS
ncbi:nitrate reductase molybdenum cofactor assembly chaperone [Angustibacter sp. Root456]|uniref:nitrate reductase molybdenum cofactor assembly chaperone n=1 Tax=Angustibacter sp. Root456 TaxID=1736539 RepID=UPI0006F56EA9|nr:nitrate reductase molybdenum cofactor assembly chaperone [Angustibacter sp. Root456]KQX66269.1 nitrate reductase [Angustibacter sp. Root456]